MVLSIIQTSLNQYKRLITEYPDYDELYKWEALKNFQDNWDPEAKDFREMYDQSLQCSTHDNLWASQFFYPKAVMLNFIALNPERVRNMFRELFDEEGKDIESRIDHFVYHCDQMLPELQKENPMAMHHYHDGYRIISLYLAFRYPTQYCLYKFTEFKHFMTKVRAASIPGTNELGRFFKVMRTLNSILTKDTELLAISRRLRSDPKYYQGESLLLAQDFYWCSHRYPLEKYPFN